MIARGRLHQSDRDNMIPSDADLDEAQSALDLGRLYGYSETTSRITTTPGAAARMSPIPSTYAISKRPRFPLPGRPRRSLPPRCPQSPPARADDLIKTRECPSTIPANPFSPAWGFASRIGLSAGFRTPTSLSFWPLPLSRWRRSVNGAPPVAVAVAFGDGFWSLITFTMQMVMVVIGGYVVASSPPAARLIDAFAGLPRNGRAAVAFVAAISMLTSLLNWGMSLIFSGLLVRALARRTDLRMDYRAAGAAGYLGLGATWALGLSSSAAQLQANAASLPKPLLEITGVIPFEQTIFLWQSMVILL